MITRRDFLKATGVAAAAAALTAFFHCFFRRCIRQRGILCRS